MAKIIYSDGRIADVEPKNGTDFQLDELKEIVQGYIELLHLYNDEIMILNEEGKLIDLPFNPAATGYLHTHGPFMDVIVGNVLICRTDQVK